MSFNLLERPFVPAVNADGRLVPRSLIESLTEAGRIREIRAASPLDTFALYRFLLAVLQWCECEPNADDLYEIRKARRLPQPWLTKLCNDRAQFDLLGDGPRFYQDKSRRETAPNRHVSDLFSDLPAGTEVNHFCHVSDTGVALCRTCCALGLIRLPAFAMQGGQGKAPSINNAPPVYFLPLGSMLLDTLLLNWPLPSVADDRPAWDLGPRLGAAGSGEIGPMEGFTWQARSVWLGPVVEDSQRQCSRCGESGPVISSLVFEKGRRRRSDPRNWRDPHVARGSEPSKQRASSKDDSDDAEMALRGRDPLKNPDASATLWRREVRAILQSIGTLPDPAPIPGVAAACRRLAKESSLRILAVEPFTKQAKSFDVSGRVWLIPSNVRTNADLRTAMIDELDRLDKVNVGAMVAKALPRNAKQRPDVWAALADLRAEAEERLRHRFDELMADLPGTGPRGVEERVGDWHKHRAAILCDLARRASAVIGPGSALRRREQVAALGRDFKRAIGRIDRAAEESAPNAEQPADAFQRTKTRKGKS